MPIEIRPPREDEQERVNFVVAYSFSGDRTAEGRERMRHVEDMAPALCLYDGGELTAALRVYPMRMSVNGAMIGMGGVSSVSCLPEQRRKGHVARLLRQALSDMREAGRPLSALYTPHPSLYRKFGWMTASGNLKYTWKPKSVAPYSSAPPAGRAQRLTEEEWPLLAGVYSRFAAGRTGYLERPERWWKEAVYRVLYDPERKLNDVAAWMDGDAAGGYMTYSSQRERRGSAGEVTTFFIREFIALTSSAYVGLLRFALSHDLANEIGWHGPLDDPLALAVDDAQQVKREWVDDYMLRVVDVEQAIGARPPALGAPEGAFTIEITDAAAPWNQGAWRIECAGGKLSAQRAGAAQGDIATDAATFAAIYGGFLRSTDAARCGLAEAGNHEAALLADRILASDYAPYGSDFGF